MQDFRKLIVWQRAHKLTVDVYQSTRRFPSDERFGLISQIRRAAVSIEANIAEGCGRGTRLDFARFLQQAMGSATEVECHLLISRDLGILSPADHREQTTKTVEIKRMLATLIERVRRPVLTEN